MSLLIRPAGSYEIVVNIRALHAMQDIQEENTRRNAMILEAANCTALAALFRHVIGPFHHLAIRHLPLAQPLRQSRQGERDVLRSMYHSDFVENCPSCEGTYRGLSWTRLLC